MTPYIGSVQFFKMAAVFTTKNKNEHKMDSFQDIKLIFVAKCMFLGTAMSNMTQSFVYHFSIWPKFKMAAIF